MCWDWTGKKGLIYHGIPDWFYANTPELKSETIAFSADGAYLSFLSFNDTNVNEYRCVSKSVWMTLTNNKIYSIHFVPTDIHFLAILILNIHKSNRFVIQKRKQEIQM